jgi:hypothetical protein
MTEFRDVSVYNSWGSVPFTEQPVRVSEVRFLRFPSSLGRELDKKGLKSNLIVSSRVNAPISDGKGPCKLLETKNNVSLLIRKAG